MLLVVCVQIMLVEWCSQNCYVLFQLKNSVAAARQKTYLFECLELDELSSLIETYSPEHAIHWRHPKTTARKINGPVFDRITVVKVFIISLLTVFCYSILY